MLLLKDVSQVVYREESQTKWCEQKGRRLTKVSRAITGKEQPTLIHRLPAPKNILYITPLYHDHNLT